MGIKLNTALGGSITLEPTNTANNVTVNLPVIANGSIVTANASGNVGIGTDSPTQKLTIANGSANITDGLLSINRAAYPVVQVQQTGSTGVGQFAMNGNNLEIRQTQNFDTLLFTNNLERMRLNSIGDFQFGNANTASNTLRFFDIYNTDTGAAAGAIIRLVTNNATNSAATTVDMVKYRTNGFLINNNDTSSSNFTSFNVGASERLRIDNLGNVGIGTSAPTARVSLGARSGTGLYYINGTGAQFSADNGIRISSSNSGNASIGGGLDLINNTFSAGSYSPVISFGSISSNGSFNSTYAGIYGILGGQGTDVNWTRGSLAFATASAAGIVERARITDAGILLLGTTTVSDNTSGAKFEPQGTDSGNVLKIMKTFSGGRNAILMYSQGNYVGGLNFDNTNTSLATSSDVRLKENITDAASVYQKINQIKIRSFDWKTDGSHTDYGFVAQELIELFPEAVTVGSDKDDGSIAIPWSVSPSNLIPHMIKAMQELKQIVDQQAARIEALENK